jgi:hypothetical protein
MTIRINQKIQSCEALGTPPQAPATETLGSEPPAPETHEVKVIQMHEKLERPEVLIGATYKIKSPLFEHALYVTINDIVLNAGTEFEMRRPFEIFINSKNMDHFQWIVALTRIMSAVFRKGGDVTFLVEELRAVFDPRGGYFRAGGVYMPSIVAELGNIIEQHLTMIGLIKDTELSDAQRALIAEKRAAFERRNAKKNSEISAADALGGAMVEANDASNPVRAEGRPAESGTAPSLLRGEEAIAAGSTDSAGTFPAGAALCGKCNTQALVLLDGCQTCLNCGYSKCG